MKGNYPEKFLRKLGELNTNDLDEENENYFNMEACRKDMQIFEFEEVFNQKFVKLFGRKLAFSNRKI